MKGGKFQLKKIRKNGRVTTVKKLTTVVNTDISLATFYDNTIVNLGSSYVGSKP